jgi:hypothetical protein
VHFCEQVDEKRKMTGESSSRLALIYEFLSNTGDDCGQLPEEIRESFNTGARTGCMTTPSLRGAGEENEAGRDEAISWHNLQHNLREDCVRRLLRRPSHKGLNCSSQ